MKYMIIDLEDNIIFSQWKKETFDKIKINDKDNIKIMKCLRKIFKEKRVIGL